MEDNIKGITKRLNRPITRRQAIKVGGLTAAGLIFSKPAIETIRPTPVFAVSPVGKENKKITSDDFVLRDVFWAIDHQLEELCAPNNPYAGSYSSAVGTIAALGGEFFSTTSMAWDWGTPAPGAYTPTLPHSAGAGRPSATIFGGSDYDVDFYSDPTIPPTPLLCSITPTVSATGLVTMAAVGSNPNSGSNLYGKVAGGEIYEGGNVVDGDSQEQFQMIDIIGGDGAFAGATGSLTSHISFAFDFSFFDVLLTGSVTLP